MSDAAAEDPAAGPAAGPAAAPASESPDAAPPRARWFVRGDLDGFFGLAIDNLVQLLLIDTLCTTVLGFPPALVHGRILPGAAVSILVGNLFYSWQARRLALRTGRSDVCALPYGINTVSLFAHVFLVMLPAKLVAEAAGARTRRRWLGTPGWLPASARGRSSCSGAPCPSGSGGPPRAPRCCRLSPGSP